MAAAAETKVLIIGSGGREDALLWSLRKSPLVGEIFVAPGNGGTERFPDTRRIHLDPKNITEILEAAEDLNAGLVTVIGPEEPLVNGVVDRLREKNLMVFGPDAKAARLEGSKVYAVRFMEKYGIPHPQSYIFNSYHEAVNFLAEPGEENQWKSWSLMNWGLVVKVDGLAGGKGVFVLGPENEGGRGPGTGWAFHILEEIMIRKQFGDAGNCVVIQSKLDGFEISATVIVAGDKYTILPYSEDHKQAYDDDRGPNTGGMGVAAPHPLVTPQLAQTIEEMIIKPTLYGLKQEGIEFRGVLYPGIMVTEKGPKVLEYNVRFGDPETECILPIISSDLFPVLRDAAKGVFVSEIHYPVRDDYSVTATLTSKGYPIQSETGEEIFGLENLKPDSDVVVFHAGTSRREDGTYESSGGRVLMVTGIGDSIENARKKAYGAIGPTGIHFEGMRYRKDIGARKRNI